MDSDNVIRELDGVELIEDHSLTLIKGMRGTVVHEYSPTAPVVLVEFADENGETIEMVDIPRTLLRLFWKFNG